MKAGKVFVLSDALCQRLIEVHECGNVVALGHFQPEIPQFYIYAAGIPTSIAI